MGKDIITVDVIRHINAYNIFPVCTKRGAKKGTVGNSSVSSTEVAQLIVIDSVLTSIENGVSWGAKGLDLARQLAQLAPNYMQQFLGGLVTLGLLNVSREGNSNVFCPNMEFCAPAQPLYIQLGAPVSYGTAQSTIKHGVEAVKNNFFLLSPRKQFLRSQHSVISPESSSWFDGYWLIAYNFSEFLADKTVSIFAAYDNDARSAKLRETWLAINNVDPLKIKNVSTFDINAQNFWEEYTTEKFQELGVIMSSPNPEYIKALLFDPRKQDNVAVVVKEAVVANTGTKVINNDGKLTAPSVKEVKVPEIKEVQTEPVVSKDTGVAKDYVPRVPTEFVKPVENPFAKSTEKKTKEEPPKGSAKEPVKNSTKEFKNTSIVDGLNRPPSKRNHEKSDLLKYTEELISSAMTPAAKDYLLHAIVEAAAFRAINK